MPNIGQLLRQIRIERGITQDELAARLGCIKQTISNYERNLRTPAYETLEALADVLNVPMSFFLSTEEQQEALQKIYATYGTTLPLSENSLELAKLYDSLNDEGRAVFDTLSAFVRNQRNR